MPRPITAGFNTAQERDAAILSMLDEGMTTQLIATTLGLTRGTVKVYAWRGARAVGRSRQLRLAGFRDKRSRDVWIYKEWRAGRTLTCVARELALTKSLVWRTVHFIDAHERAKGVSSPNG